MIVSMVLACCSAGRLAQTLQARRVAWLALLAMGIAWKVSTSSAMALTVRTSGVRRGSFDRLVLATEIKVN